MNSMNASNPSKRMDGVPNDQSGIAGCPPEMSLEVSRRLATLVGQSRVRSRDTLMYLVMTELHKLCPTLSEAQLTALCKVALAEVERDK